MSNQTVPLNEIELELRDLSVRQRKNWQRIVYLLLTVQEGGLFKPAHGSFSDWLRHFASEIGLHEATFWRYYAAGSYYLSKTGEPVEAIEKTAISPSKLELVKRIEEHSPDLGEDLFKKVVIDDPNMTTRYLTKTWEKIRDGKTQEDAKAQELQPTIEHLLSEFSKLTDDNKLRLFRTLLESIGAKGGRDILDRAIVQFRQANH